MSHHTHFVGLDVHKARISMGVAAAGREPALSAGEFPSHVSQVLRRLRRLGAPARIACCYEAGPTGFVLARQLEEKGYHCDVVAPSKIPVQAGRRVKTDRRDALQLAEYLRSGHLVPVEIPDEECESMRDLVRSRDEARKAFLRARQQTLHFLLRHDRKWLDGKNWTLKHWSWIRKQEFQLPAHQRVMDSYLVTLEQTQERLKSLENEIETLYPQTKLGPLVKALQAMRGVKTVVSATLAYELGNLRRFQSARQLMSYVGIVPSESSSGERRRLGPITKTGNGYVRRVLVEAAWSYRYRPSMSQDIRKRNEGVAPGVQKIAWKAQARLNTRWRRLQARGKDRRATLTAIAREMLGFVWAIGQEDPLLAT